MARRIFPAPEAAFEIDPVEGNKVGRDPRKMSLADLAACGHEPAPILRIVRQKCLDCCGGLPSEVRRCTAIACPLWAIRMSSNPFRSRTRGPDPDAENPAYGGGFSDAEDPTASEVPA